MQDAHDPAFEDHRSLLFHIAYRMLGTVSDAEDLVQEAWIRWQRRRDPDAVRAPRAYLAQVITRLAIDRLREARRAREEYVGTWLPEPLLTDPAPAAEDATARAETLRMGFLVLLERLDPVQRAVFVLREAFDYEYAEIAAILGKGEANCRQILARARRRLETDQPRRAHRAGTDRADSDAVAVAFLAALASRDMGRIERLLAEVVVYSSDGGGKARSARKPVLGAERVVRFLTGILGKLPAGVEPRPARVNGEPGLLLLVDGRPYSAAAFEIAAGRVRALHVVMNPDKLAHLA